MGKSEAGVYRYGDPWCSTKTTDKHVHISNGGFYGDCLEESCSSAGEANEVLDSVFDNHIGMTMVYIKESYSSVKSFKLSTRKKNRL